MNRNEKLKAIDQPLLGEILSIFSLIFKHFTKNSQKV